jgi:hypothetical protein
MIYRAFPAILSTKDIRVIPQLKAPFREQFGKSSQHAQTSMHRTHLRQYSVGNNLDVYDITNPIIIQVGIGAGLDS